MEHAANLFKLPPVQKDRSTERGELLKFFMSVLNPDRKKKGMSEISISRMGYILAKIPTKDLWALKSKVEDASRRQGRNHRSVAPGAVFWSEIRAPRPESGVTLK